LRRNEAPRTLFLLHPFSLSARAWTTRVDYETRVLAFSIQRGEMGRAEVREGDEGMRDGE